MAMLSSNELRFVPAHDPGFPSGLAQLPKPLPGVWVRGALPEQPVVGVVGSRAASRQGCDVAKRWAADLVCEGYGTVSGGALGIDAAGHEGTLEAGGFTFAVLGCGVDVVYPDRHGPLFGRIAAQGGLLSEYPPGTGPRPGQFPVRNRLIVALAQAVVVIEARLRSGALVTARLAHRRGKRLLALPGSAGTDWLLQSGMAWPVTDKASLLQALSDRPAGAPSAGARAAVVVPPVVEALRAGMETPAAVALYLGRPLSDVMAALVEAELEGWVHRGAGSRYEVTRTIHGH